MSQTNAVHDLLFYYNVGGVATLLDAKQPMVAGTTYYARIGGAGSPWSSLWHKFDATVALTTITVESINIDAQHSPGSIGADFWGGASLIESGNANWAQEPNIPVLTRVAGAALAVIQHNAGGGQKQSRLVVVCGTGGNYRCRPHFKS